MAFTESSTQTENTDLNSNYSLEIQLLKIRLASALDPYLQTINYSEDHIECLHGAMLTLSKQVYDQITDPEKQAKEIRLIHASVSSLLEKTERKRTERVSRLWVELIQILYDGEDLATKGGLSPTRQGVDRNF